MELNILIVTINVRILNSSNHELVAPQDCRNLETGTFSMRISEFRDKFQVRLTQPKSGSSELRESCPTSLETSSYFHSPTYLSSNQLGKP